MNAPTNTTFVDSSMRNLAERISCLPIDERSILETLLTRMGLGRRLYGPWIIDGDNRDYPVEALAEVIDSLHYCAAELIRGRRLSSTRRKRVYVCHPFSGDVSGNAEKIRKICRELVDEGVLPIAPQLFLPAFIDETTERELALELCCEFVELSDEVRVYQANPTTGMGRELERAKQRRIPIVLARKAAL
ncbi:MAG TPA: DUF4406 domain-containing protein [Polyangiaceae bacterium]|nr:DUF4406 domain-containing protein [Polyangiaceae bacterium]